jgi:hypothetical protein
MGSMTTIFEELQRKYTQTQNTENNEKTNQLQEEESEVTE